MIDEDEVDLKEQPEDTWYINNIIKTLSLLGAADSETGREGPRRGCNPFPDGGAEIHSQAHHLPQDVTPWILSWWEQVYIGPIFGVPNLFLACCCHQ